MKHLFLVFTLFIFNHVVGQEQPNIILMMTDDQGWGDVGNHSNPYLKTPHIDKLAREGAEITQFTACPNCSPTRAGLLTGRYNYRTGVTEVMSGCHLMYTDEVTIAEALRESGYRTGIFGKWHLGSNYPMRPTDQGFDEALVHKGGGIGQAAGPPGNTYFDPVLEHNNVSKRAKGYCDDIFTDAAMEFMEKSDTPFFVYLASNLPHFPLVVSDDKADVYRKMGLHEHNALTYGMISSIDDNVGRIMGHLDALGIAENTIVIFMSDNGPRTRRSKNDKYPDRFVANLRGTKTSVYENGIRVPFYIKWPRKIEEGKVYDEMAGHIDVFPTLLEAAGVPLPTSREIDGVSLLPRLTNRVGSMPVRNLFFQWHTGPIPYQYVHFAVRSDRYKLVQGLEDPHSFIQPPTSDQLHQMLGSLELYDIIDDPSEINNVAREHPEVVEHLLASYEEWFAKVTRDRDYHLQERTILGTAMQEEVILSSFDRRGGRPPLDGGYWDVSTPDQGTYQIKVQFAPTKEATSLHLRYAGLHWQKAVNSNMSEVIFEHIILPMANDRLQVFLKSGRIPEGVDYVEISRED